MINVWNDMSASTYTLGTWNGFLIFENSEPIIIYCHAGQDCVELDWRELLPFIIFDRFLEDKYMIGRMRTGSRLQVNCMLSFNGASNTACINFLVPTWTRSYISCRYYPWTRGDFLIRSIFSKYHLARVYTAFMWTSWKVMSAYKWTW